MIQITFHTKRTKNILAYVDLFDPNAIQESIANTFAGALNGTDPKTIKVTVKLVGDLGGTYGFNGDSYPITVHQISPDGKKLFFSEDHYTYNRETQQFDFSNVYGNSPQYWKVARFKARRGYPLRFRFSTTWGLSFGRRDYTQNPHI